MKQDTPLMQQSTSGLKVTFGAMAILLGKLLAPLKQTLLMEKIY